MEILPKIITELRAIAKKQKVTYTFLKKQFRIGFDIEKEHRKQLQDLGIKGEKLKYQISLIVLAHLKESAYYYTALVRMEKKLNKKPEKMGKGAGIKTSNGASGGEIQGDSHAEPSGGVKAVVVDDGRPVLLEGKEIIINKKSAQDPEKKHIFDGKRMSNKEVLNAINTENGNGVPIMEKGGSVMKQGGSIDESNIFENTLYRVYVSADTENIELYFGENLTKAESEFNYADVKENPYKTRSVDVVFESRTDKYQFVGTFDEGIGDSIEDYPFEECKNDKEYYKMIEEGEWEIVKTKELEGYEATARNIREQVEEWLKETFDREIGSYKNILLGEDANENDIYMTIRIKDHSENPRNRGTVSDENPYLSIAIANINATRERFHSGYELYFDGDDSFEKIKEEVIYYIKDVVENNSKLVKLSDNLIDAGFDLNESLEQGGELKNEIKPIDNDETTNTENMKNEDILKLLIPPSQYSVKSGDFEIAKEGLLRILNQIPELYSQDGKKGDTICYLHYFTGALDIYITEMNITEDDNGNPSVEMYGYGSAFAEGDFEGAYYYSENMFEYMPRTINIDYHFDPIKLSEIKDKRNKYYVESEVAEPIKLHADLNKKFNNQYELNQEIEKFIEVAEPSILKGEKLNPEDIEMIQTYTGYGGLGKYMDVEKDIEKIKGTLFEYYTPYEIVKKCWGLAYKYGFNGDGLVLEPSCGVGRFIKYAPKKENVYGYEINKTSFLIAKATFFKANIVNDYFESEFYTGHGKRTRNIRYSPKFDLVIGNAPFGEYTGKYSTMGEKDYSQATQIDHHFLLRGLDALKTGGLLVMIVNSGFMQSGHEKIKKNISSKGTLIDAYRLPTGIFQNTEVTADILIIRKK